MMEIQFTTSEDWWVSYHHTYARWSVIAMSTKRKQMEGNISLRQLKSGSQFQIYFHNNLYSLVQYFWHVPFGRKIMNKAGAQQHTSVYICMKIYLFSFRICFFFFLEISFYEWKLNDMHVMVLLCGKSDWSAQPQRTNDFHFCFDLDENLHRLMHITSDWLDTQAIASELFGHFHSHSLISAQNSPKMIVKGLGNQCFFRKGHLSMCQYCIWWNGFG